MEKSVVNFLQTPEVFKPMQGFIWRSHYHVINVITISLLSSEELNIYRDTTANNWNPLNSGSVTFCGKVFDQERVLKNHKSLHMLQHHKQLQAQKKKEAEEAAKKKEQEKGEEGNSNQSSQPSENQPEPQPGSSTQSSVAEDLQSQGSSLSPGDILRNAVIVKKQEGDEEDPDLQDILSLM